MESVAVFGATGRTGRCVIDALDRVGISTRGLARTAGTLRGTPAVEIVGSLENADSVAETLDGCTAACVVFGPRPPFTDLFCAAATELIVAEMNRCGVSRIVCQTGAMIGKYRGNRTAPFEFMSAVYRRRQPAAHADRVQQEEFVQTSGLAWTLLKPPRLTMRLPAADLQFGPNVRVGLLSSVSRIELGDLISSEITQPRNSHSTIFVRR